jgi:hypothetical protein
MASYMHNPMFGQDDSEDSGWGYDAGGSGISAGDLIGAGTSIFDTIAHIIQPSAYQQPSVAVPLPQTYAPPLGIAPGSVVAAGSISSNMLLIGGLGLAALFFFRKK